MSYILKKILKKIQGGRKKGKGWRKKKVVSE
jgi:hypothetical protein